MNNRFLCRDEPNLSQVLLNTRSNQVRSWHISVDVAIRLKINSVALVRKRTIPTDRPPLVGEVTAKLCG
jgi:hypothetical protein